MYECKQVLTSIKSGWRRKVFGRRRNQKQIVVEQRSALKGNGKMKEKSHRS